MPKNEHSMVPKVTEATLADMVDGRAPSQDELWVELGKQGQGAFAVGAMIQAARLEASGTSPRDAALYMAAWTIAVLTRQGRRDEDLLTLNTLFESPQLSESQATACGAVQPIGDGAGQLPGE